MGKPPEQPPRVRLIKRSTTEQPEPTVEPPPVELIEEEKGPPRVAAPEKRHPPQPRPVTRPPRRELPYREPHERTLQGPIRSQYRHEPMRRQFKPAPGKGVMKRPMGRKPPPAGYRKPAAPRPPTPKPVRLTLEQRQQVEQLYQAMVISGDRPPEGRRKKIAGQLGVPYELVSEVVRSYLQHDRLRRTNFDIEKIYWREVMTGQDDANLIAQKAAEELKLDVGRIWWWLQKLHEWPKTLHKDPDVNEEQKAAILAAYQEYLKSSEPPEKGLHMTLSEKVGGVTPRQVHKTLLQCRLSFWNRLKNTIPT